MKKTLFIFFQHLVPQHLLSRAVGYLAECNQPWLKNWLIKSFIKHFNVDMSEAEDPSIHAYKNFNSFFTRALKPGIRPIDEGTASITSPADGEISEMGKIEYGRILQAKGRGYGLTNLLGGSQERSKPFIDGSFCTIYLSPKDYHRVHMPCAGQLVDAIYIPGDLYSVNQTTADSVDNLFARNERLVCMFDTDQGPMAMVLVGAMIVAGIETSWSGQVAPLPKAPLRIFQNQADQSLTLQKGDEMGRFKLGSTVILLFPPNTIDWREKLSAGSSVKMGEMIAQYPELETKTA